MRRWPGTRSATTSRRGLGWPSSPAPTSRRPVPSRRGRRPQAARWPSTSAAVRDSAPSSSPPRAGRVPWSGWMPPSSSSPWRGRWCPRPGSSATTSPRSRSRPVPADIIYARLVLAHLPDPPALLARWREHLAPGRGGPVRGARRHRVTRRAVARVRRPIVHHGPPRRRRDVRRSACWPLSAGVASGSRPARRWRPASTRSTCASGSNAWTWGRRRSACCGSSAAWPSWRTRPAPPA